ncbi:MAG TPA: hypothetical protein VLD18_16045 [Verrucomicrobiae bacterium]|nr:hypothetical protein [Verrucomicrobiae bacterium]
MRAGLILSGGFAFAALILTGFHPAMAAERGKFVGHSVLMATKFNEIKAPEGHPYKAALSGELDGLLFHNGGGHRLDRLLDRAHYIVQWVGDAGTGTGYCMKTFTTSEGHKLFARCDSKDNEKGSTGTVTLLGGTGPFAGIKGKGRFNFVGVTDRVFWDDIEWEWETP